MSEFFIKSLSSESPVRRRSVFESPNLDSPCKNTRLQSKLKNEIQFEFHSEDEEEVRIESANTIFSVEWISQNMLKTWEFCCNLLEMKNIAAGEAIGKFEHLKPMTRNLKRISAGFLLAVACVLLIGAKQKSIEKVDNLLLLRNNSSLHETPKEPSVEQIFVMFQSKLTPLLSKLNENANQIQHLKSEFSSLKESKEAHPEEDFNDKYNALMEELAKVQENFSVKQDEINSLIEVKVNSDLSNKFGKFISNGELDKLLAAKVTAVMEEEITKLEHKSSIIKRFGADYSLFSAGASVSSHSDPYTGANQKSVLGIRYPTGPNNVLDDNIDPGNCWGMKGLYFLT